MILVIAEQQSGGKLNRATWETIVGAQQLAALTGGDGASASSITVLALGASVGSVAAELAAAQVAEIVTVESAALEPYTPDGFTAALQDAITQLSPSHVLLPHTYQTRDFAPKLAARLDRAILTDVTGVKAGAETAFVRSMFQGKLTADVVPQGPAPHFVTFQIGAYRVDQVVKGASPAPVRALNVTVDASAIREKPEAPFQQAKQAVDLSQAERIVSVGRGIKEQTNIALAQQLAEALGAEIAASRPICDAGWLPMERQVGSSGQTVAPKLYLALGISGAIQHLVGMKGSSTIVAINKDPDAPIFEIADYGIVGDLFEIVPAIIAAVKG
jgi:electron transfer flavoprotein alpha subunit